MDILLVGGLLLLVMMLLLSGGVWIAMTLAICGWVGQAFFTTTQPGKNLFSAFWESNASWELAALPLLSALAVPIATTLADINANSCAPLPLKSTV